MLFNTENNLIASDSPPLKPNLLKTLTNKSNNRYNNDTSVIMNNNFLINVKSRFADNQDLSTTGLLSSYRQYKQGKQQVNGVKRSRTPMTLFKTNITAIETQNVTQNTTQNYQPLFTEQTKPVKSIFGKGVKLKPELQLNTSDMSNFLDNSSISNHALYRGAITPNSGYFHVFLQNKKVIKQEVKQQTQRIERKKKNLRRNKSAINVQNLAKQNLSGINKSTIKREKKLLDHGIKSAFLNKFRSKKNRTNTQASFLARLKPKIGQELKQKERSNTFSDIFKCKTARIRPQMSEISAQLNNAKLPAQNNKKANDKEKGNKEKPLLQEVTGNYINGVKNQSNIKQEIKEIRKLGKKLYKTSTAKKKLQKRESAMKNRVNRLQKEVKILDKKLKKTKKQSQLIKERQEEKENHLTNKQRYRLDIEIKESKQRTINRLRRMNSKRKRSLSALKQREEKQRLANQVRKQKKKGKQKKQRKELKRRKKLKKVHSEIFNLEKNLRDKSAHKQIQTQRTAKRAVCRKIDFEDEQKQNLKKKILNLEEEEKLLISKLQGIYDQQKNAFEDMKKMNKRECDFGDISEIQKKSELADSILDELRIL